MRCLMLLLLLSAAQFAQTQPPAPMAAPRMKPLPLKPPGLAQDYLADPNTFYRFLKKPNGSTVTKPPVDTLGQPALLPKQPCGIPLINVLGPSVDIDKGMLRPIPRGGVEFPMKPIPLPAPPCEDVKK